MAASVNYSDTVIALIISSSVTVDVVAVSLFLDITFWPEMKTKEKRDNHQKSNSKQTKTNISKKLHKLREHKNSENILIKLISLMEVNGRQA